MSGARLTIVCSLLITTFIGFMSFAHSNPDGFLNINCGAIDNQTDKNDLLWISDAAFIKSRNISSVSSTTILYLQYLTMAYFSNPAVKKYCYLLPVKPPVKYLVRVTFVPNSKIVCARFFDLLIEGIKWRSVNLSDVPDHITKSYEIILIAKNETLSICLAPNSQTEENKFIFISSIELRPLEPSMYSSSTDFQKKALDLVSNRMNFGASDWLKYPNDPFDRKWSWMVATNIEVNISTEGEQTKSLGRELLNKPPASVLRTAIARRGVGELAIPNSFLPLSSSEVYYVALYFCNIFITNYSNHYFTAHVNGIQITDYIHLSFLECWQANKDLELENSNPINITLKSSPPSELGPFINAGEMYRKLDLKTTTYSGDVVAIRKIAEAINVPDDWTGGDPCLPAEYSSTGITCSQDDPPRIIILNLTSMHVEGVIPSHMADLTALIQLLLGNNSLSGHVPDFSSLKNLTILQLQNNQLTGEIPRSLEKLQMLNQLLLQGNKFEGTVSKGLVRDNLDLGVDPQNAVPVDRGKNKGWLIGLPIACSLVSLLIILSGIFLWMHKRTSQPFPPIDDLMEEHTSPDKKNQIDFKEYTEEEIKSFTKGYKTSLDTRSPPSVYHGVLPVTGREVAVKILITDSNQGHEEFEKEVSTLSTIFHSNLVSLYGYCGKPIVALVYEYVPDGTLTDRLYGEAKLKKPLDWVTRLNIAQQAAKGLLRLHQNIYPHQIIHGNINSNNILLDGKDGKMTAKLADFGLPKLVESLKSNIKAEVKRTEGYLDPEYKTFKLNDKSDIYSFGVVLLEIISGRRPKEGIVESARNLLSSGKLAELMDTSLLDRYNVESARKVAEIAKKCVEEDSIKRPDMNEVVKELEEAAGLASCHNNYSASDTTASFNIDDMSGHM